MSFLPSTSAEDVIGGVGGGEELQRSWFTEERLGIAARCVGAMWRLIEETVAWSLGDGALPRHVEIARWLLEKGNS